MNRDLSSPLDVTSFSERFLYVQSTKEVTVEVWPEFLPNQSKVSQSVYSWAYHVKIRNESKNRIQLINRMWIITNGARKIEEVYGSGVCGEQPIILPECHYVYTSGCPLRTPTGSMRGWYEFTDIDSQEKFRVRIPLFFLRTPSQVH
jgi:ApaG protein